MWRELIVLAVIVVAVVARGWPRRRRDRWRVTFQVERDRSNPPDDAGTPLEVPGSSPTPRTATDGHDVPPEPPGPTQAA